MFSPRMFGKYYLVDRLAVGGMAEIFRAKMYGVDGFEKDMVVKQILPQYARNREFIQMFVDEAKITVSLSHGNIVPVFELGQIEGVYFIAMEQVDGKNLGETLDACLDQGKGLSLPHALFVSAEMLAGLAYAHRRADEQGQPLGIVHRDISPQNILLSYEGEVKIVDFGIARAATKMHETQAGVIKGKFGYMSPEQAMGHDVDARSDIFAAGILLFEMLTLERLFASDREAVTLDRVKRADVPTPSKVNPALSPRLDAIMFKALARRPEDRFQTADEMRQAVLKHLFELNTVANASTLSGYLKDLFAAELAERRKQPRLSLPPPAQAAPAQAAPVQARPQAAPPAPARLPARPDALLSSVPVAGPAVPVPAAAPGARPGALEVGPGGDGEEALDDFSYLRAGRRIKLFVLLGVVLGLAAFGFLFRDQIARVFTTVNEVIDESSHRLARKQLGTVTVNSRPSGAKVYFGGRQVGTTNLRIGSIDPDQEFELVLTLEGHPPWSRMIKPSDWKQGQDKMEIEVYQDWTAGGLK
ncbi:MAG TPA: serine/threonine-protein kinase [Myxococcota bacterium]|nr:serine/threonine-protein kinase [Myxococcota bacterium]HRY94116.1 serine/threonine-protein kinase [Myxococcota bacterium]HSA22921.1 serine/threonine-protein kinase [Myxococcota bacterium]